MLFIAQTGMRVKRDKSNRKEGKKRKGLTGPTLEKRFGSFYNCTNTGIYDSMQF